MLDGRDINLAQVQDGFAWHFKRYAHEQTANDRMVYADAEDRARTARRGLWKDLEPMAPWEFRNSAKTRRAP